MDFVKYMKKGSMTVEAAFVVPVVLMVIFLLLSLMMHMHNYAWYTAVAAETLITASTKGVCTDHDRGTHGFPSGSISKRTVTQGNQIRIEIEMTSRRIPMLPVWDTKISEETTVLKPVLWIRGIQGVKAWEGENGGS